MASYSVVTHDPEQPGQPLEDSRFRRLRCGIMSAAAALFATAVTMMAVAAWHIKFTSVSQPSLLHMSAQFENKVPKLIPVAPDLAHFPPLCDKAIVRETCALMNNATPEYFGTVADSNATVIHASEIAFGIVADRASVIDLLKHIGVKNVETNQTALQAGAFAVECQELCQKTVASFADDHLAAVSDVACYVMPGTGSKLCDVDASPKNLSTIRHWTSRAHVSQGGATFQNTTPKEPENAALDELDDGRYPAWSPGFLKVMLAQMFRIHPLSSATFGGKVKEQHTEAQARRLRNNNDCQYANDGTCDDGSKGARPYCHHGTDCTDCGNCHSNADTCRYHSDGECDEVEFCPAGTDCTDCKNCDGGDANYGGGGDAATSAVVRKSMQNLAKAQAWASNALRKVGANQLQNLLKLWFKSAAPDVRAQVKKTAASSIAVLENAEIRTNRHECNKQRGVLAYVHPGQKVNGKYVIYMCDSSLDLSEMEFVGTLYHEASHHPTARRDDVRYGRRECKNLGTRSALNNADSHEYFVEDVNKDGAR